MRNVMMPQSSSTDVCLTWGRGYAKIKTFLSGYGSLIADRRFSTHRHTEPDCYGESTRRAVIANTDCLQKSTCLCRRGRERLYYGRQFRARTASHRRFDRGTDGGLPLL